MPCSLTYLEFGHNFNQKIEKDILPNSLMHLTFGNEFKQPIEKNVLPISCVIHFFDEFGNKLD